MPILSPNELKMILQSKRINFYYLEHCHIIVNRGRVEYITSEGKQSLYWNIPIANTTAILLGENTSISQEVMRKFAQSGVLVAAYSIDDAPLTKSKQTEVDLSWLTLRSESRPTEYLHHWVSFWFDETLRAKAAKLFQQQRVFQIRTHWINKRQEKQILNFNTQAFATLLDNYLSEIEICCCKSIAEKSHEIEKNLFQFAANTANFTSFINDELNEKTQLLHFYYSLGNQLIYNLSATAIWVLGIPHNLSLLNGKTHRAGLLFEVADLIKEAIILPQAFISVAIGENEESFRHHCIEAFQQIGVLDIMLDTLIAASETASRIKR